jgi:hypothetical protein
MAKKNRKDEIMWEVYLLSIIAFLLCIGILVQSIRVWLWKDRYKELVKLLNLKFGEKDAKEEGRN